MRLALHRSLSRSRFLTFRLFAIALAGLSACVPASFAASDPRPATPALPSGTVVVGKSQWLVQRPLPLFTLYTADEQAVPAQTLVQSGYWIVVYRDANCTQCDALMKSLSAHSPDASRIVIVVSGITGSNLLKLEQQYPDLADARWLRDVKHNFSSAMNIAGTPHVVGMRNGAIRWQHAGASADDLTFPAAIDSWLKYNLLPPNKLVRTPLKKPTDQKAQAAGANGRGTGAPAGTAATAPPAKEPK
jgi:hypothetical protein